MVSIGYRPAGAPIALSVTSSATAVTPVTPAPGANATFASFMNMGAKEIQVVICPIGNTPPTPVFPLTGVVAQAALAGVTSFILPPVMTQPIAIPVPPNGFNLMAISASTTGIIYVQPLEAL